MPITYKKYLPNVLKRKLRSFNVLFCTYWNYSKDANLYLKARRNKTKASYDSYVFATAHSLEKGLSLNKRRSDFGEAKVQNLLTFLHVNHWNLSKTSIEMALGALTTYKEFRLKENNSTELTNEITRLCTFISVTYNIRLDLGGTYEIRRESLEHLQSFNFEKFLKSRKSIRHFHESFSENDIQKVKQSAELAILTPSQCNRQSSKVHVFTNRTLIHELLKIQDGATGFSEEVPCLAVITNDLSYWQSPSQRNQAWLDGGLFGMTFILGLHSNGLATCTLNMAKNFVDEKIFKETANINEYERVLFLVAIGNYPEIFRVAKSHRYSADDFYKLH